MATEKPRFGERAVNRFIELVLARLVDAEQVQVRIKANLKKLAQGELDGLMIQMAGYLMRPNLRVEQFYFDIGAAAVDIQKAMKRKIELLHPSEGEFLLVITKEQLNLFLNEEVLKQIQDIHYIEQLDCEFSENTIALQFQSNSNEVAEATTYPFIPQIISESNLVVLEQQNIQGQPLPVELISSVMETVSEILNLSDVSNQGTEFLIQQVDIKPDRITVQAIAQITAFPQS